MTFFIQNSVKQTLPPQLFNFTLNVIKRVQENKVGLEFKGPHHLLIYADDNLLGININVIKKNTETLLDANKEVSLAISSEKIKYMIMSNQKTVGQNHY
jgi:hypothetical protein